MEQVTQRTMQELVSSMNFLRGIPSKLKNPINDDEFCMLLLSVHQRACELSDRLGSLDSLAVKLSPQSQRKKILAMFAIVKLGRDVQKSSISGVSHCRAFGIGQAVSEKDIVYEGMSMEQAKCSQQWKVFRSAAENVLNLYCPWITTDWMC